MSETVLPATTSQRIVEVDTLRGFALFGILIVNVTVATSLWSFGGTTDEPRLGFDGPFDHVVTAVVEALFSGRFYLLFALLFGYSFTLQIAAAQRAGISANPRLLRRCAALMVIGSAHVYLLWIGDILTLYAFLCLFLILLRWLEPRTALIGGAVLYLAWSMWAFLPGSGGIGELAELLDVVALHEGYTGSFGDTFTMQASEALWWIILIWFTQGVPALGMFLIGMAAGKRKLFTEPELMRRWAPRVLIGALVVGLPVSAVTFSSGMSWLEPPSYWDGIQEVVNPFMTFAYIAGIIMLTRSTRTARYVALLAPAGRMAASNYIMQSVVLMVIYTGYGFALADDVPPAGVIGIALVTFGAQLGFSRWWLRGHAYGPEEWVLRAATYLSVPAWRRPECVAVQRVQPGPGRCSRPTAKPNRLWPLMMSIRAPAARGCPIVVRRPCSRNTPRR
ncbi:DUF418 domain-containing protein [Nocardia sp. NPDC052112]|uniref:DUF418 domain-containing protein n=1 Tax=Nocardia sp. NPDC052112 TaxID=3155646 RepID=UPI00343199F9